MKSLLLDTVNKEVKEVNPKCLDDYYKLIDCQWVEIVTRKIGVSYFEIICDEEGTFVSDPLISAIDDFGQPMFVGNLLICGLADSEGELTDLDDKDIEYIKKHIAMMDTRLHKKLLMLTGCNY